MESNTFESKTAFEVGEWLQQEGFSQDVVAGFVGRLEQRLLFVVLVIFVAELLNEGFSLSQTHLEQEMVVFATCPGPD